MDSQEIKKVQVSCISDLFVNLDQLLIGGQSERIKFHQINLQRKMTNLCGFKYWQPSWIQKFATIKCFVVVYGLLGTIQAMGFVYFSNTMTTVEKRFEIPSAVMGEFISSFWCHIL